MPQSIVNYNFITSAALWRQPEQLRGLIHNTEDFTLATTPLASSAVTFVSADLCLHNRENALAVALTPLPGSRYDIDSTGSSGVVGVMPIDHPLNPLNSKEEKEEKIQSSIPANMENKNKQQINSREANSMVYTDANITATTIGPVMPALSTSSNMTWYSLANQDPATCLSWYDELLLVGSSRGRIFVADFGESNVNMYGSDSTLTNYNNKKNNNNNNNNNKQQERPANHVYSFEPCGALFTSVNGVDDKHATGELTTSPSVHASTTFIRSIQVNHSISSSSPNVLATCNDEVFVWDLSSTAAPILSWMPHETCYNNNNYYYYYSTLSPSSSSSLNVPSSFVMFARWAPHSDSVVLTGNYNGDLILTDTRTSSNGSSSSYNAKYRNTNAIVLPTSHGHCATCGEFNPLLPHLIAASSTDGTFAIYDLRHTLQAMLTIPSLQGDVISLSWSGLNSDLLFTSGVDGSVCAWNLRATPTYAVGKNFIASPLTSLRSTRSYLHQCTFGISLNGVLCRLGFTESALMSLAPNESHEEEMKYTLLEKNAIKAHYNASQHEAASMNARMRETRKMSRSMQNASKSKRTHSMNKHHYENKINNIITNSSTSHSNKEFFLHLTPQERRTLRSLEELSLQYIYSHQFRESMEIIAHLASVYYNAGEVIRAKRLVHYTDTNIIQTINYNTFIEDQLKKLNEHEAVLSIGDNIDNRSPTRSNNGARKERSVTNEEIYNNALNTFTREMEKCATHLSFTLKDSTNISSNNNSDTSLTIRDASTVNQDDVTVINALRINIFLREVLSKAEFHHERHHVHTDEAKELGKEEFLYEREFSHQHYHDGNGDSSNTPKREIHIFTVAAEQAVLMIIQQSSDLSLIDVDTVARIIRLLLECNFTSGKALVEVILERLVPNVKPDSPLPQPPASPFRTNSINIDNNNNKEESKVEFNEPLVRFLRSVLNAVQEPRITTNIHTKFATHLEDHFYRDMNSASRAVRAQLEITALGIDRFHDVINVMEHYQADCIRRAQPGMFGWLTLHPILIFVHALTLDSNYVTFFWSCVQLIEAFAHFPEVHRLENKLFDVVNRIHSAASKLSTDLNSFVDVKRFAVPTLRSAQTALHTTHDFLSVLLRVQLECENVALKSHLSSFPPLMQNIMHVLDDDSEMVLEAWAALMDNLINANQDELIKNYCLRTVQEFALKMEELLDVSAKKDNDERLNEVLDVCDDFIDALDVEVAVENNADHKGNVERNSNNNDESEEYEDSDNNDVDDDNGDGPFKVVDEDVNDSDDMDYTNTDNESDAHT